jgi:hypothetical protein
MDPYEMDHSQLAVELGHQVPEAGTKSFDHEEYKAKKQQAGNQKRKEGRKGGNRQKIGLVATEMTVEQEEEMYEEFLKKEHTKCIATLNEAGNEVTIVSYDWEGKVCNILSRLNTGAKYRNDRKSRL